MIAKLTLALFTSGLFAQQVDWFAQGNRALDQGKPQEAAIDFVQALKTAIEAGAPAKDRAHLRVTLATAYLEAGAYRETEAVLQEAQNNAGEFTDGVCHVELLNAWSALHVKLGQLPAAEAELKEALPVAMNLTDAGDLPATVLHNLAAVEMRTGQYARSLGHESEAMRRLSNTLAPDHPTLIRGWASLAALQYMMGEPGEAKESMEHAIRSAENTYGPTHPLLADLLMSDAVVLDKLKLHKDARRARGRALKISSVQARAGGDRATWNVREPSADNAVYLRSK